jgi:hypothetical protein
MSDCTCRHCQDGDLDAPFDPDWVSHPGSTLGELLAARAIDLDMFATQLDMRRDVLDGLLSGLVELTDDIAERLARALGPSVEFWKKRERVFREGLEAGKTWPEDPRRS